MPTIRYEIRSEYGLADQELYRAADKDDPEALLEGVAMAGLVGVLRQLGDLAEFAAKIFHDLHDEVTATSARGHGLMLRVQQLEAEFPSIEKGLLNQTSHSHFAYNEGFDWRTNLRVDQNLVTQGDMPRFILDSYEECRGPPRLFMLDKFDVAGAGACLKRYSDPSFFRVNLSSSGLMEEEVQREMKARKIKKRTSLWKNGEVPESFLAPLITPKLQPQSSNQVSSKVPTRHIKLKRRNLSYSDITSRKSYMKHLLENHSTEEKAWSEISIASSSLIVNSIDTSELTPQIPEIVSDTITDSTLVREGSPAESPTRKEVAYIPPKELENHQKVKSVQFSKSVRRKMTTPGSKTDNEKTSNVADEAEKSHSARADFTKEGAFDGDFSNGYTPEVAKSNPTVLPEVDSKTSLANVESTGEGDLDDHKSDDISSDLDNYMDALNTTGSETETDSENITKSDPLSKTGAHEMASGIYEQKNQFPIQLLQDSLEESITSNSVISHDLDNIRSLKHQSGSDVPAILDVKDTPEEAQGNFAFEECASSAHVLLSGTSNAKELDKTGIKSDIEEAPSGSCLLDSTSSHTNACCEGGDEAQSFTPLPDNREGTHVSQQLDFPVEEPSKYSNKSDTISLEFAPLSEMGDSSFGRKDEGVHLAECVEEQNLGNKEGTADHLSRVMNESTFKDTSTQHIEESTVALIANSEGEQQDSLKQDAEICLDVNMSPAILELPSETDEGTVDSSDHLSRMMSESAFKDMSVQHIEESTVVLIANSEGEQQDSLKQDAEICLDENISPAILELPSETDEGTVDSSDHLSRMMNESAFKDMSLQHVEGSTVILIAKLDGQQQDSLKQDAEICLDESISPAILDLPSETDEGTVDSSDHLSRMMNESAFKDMSLQHVEGSTVILIAKSEGQQQDSLKQDAEICLDENISPAILELPSETDEGTVDSSDHFSRMMNESGYKDMSTQQVEGSTVVLIANSEGEQQTSLKQDSEICLDENLSSTILELPSETDPTTVYTEDLADMGYTEPSKPDPLFPLSEIPGKNNSSKDDEPIYSEDVDFILRENIPEDISVRHVEDSPVSNLQIEASQEPIGQDTNICFDEDTSPSYAYLSLKNSQFTIVPDDFAVGGGVIAATGDCSNTDDLVPSESENLSNSENPQESPKVNPAEILLSSGKENFSDGMHQHLNYGTEDMGEANTLIPNIEPLELGHCFHVMGPNESHVADPLEHKPMGVMYADGMQLLSKEHDYMTSSNAEAPKESHDITDTLEFPNGSTELNLQKAAVQQGKHTEDDDSLDEFVIVEADDIQDSSSIYSGKPSGFDVQLQEDYLPHDSTLARPDMEVTETSVQKNFTLLPQDEPQSITSAAVLSSGLPTKLFDSVCCPISSETNIGKESLIYSSENEDSASKDSPSTHSFVEAELSGDHSEPNEECSNSEGEPNEISSHPEGEHLDALDTNEENIIQSIDRINADQPSKPEPYVIFSDSETNDLEVPLSSTSIRDNVKAESEPSIASKCNTEIPLTTLVSSISLSEIPSTQSSGENISETSPQEASELLPSEPSSSFQLQDIDETPPPPPLPPMEWRLGKLQFGSLTSSGDAVQHPVASNLFIELITGDEKYPANSFGSLPVEENERYRDGPPDVEIAQPSRLSQVPQIADEEGEKSSLLFKGGMVNLPNPVIIESHREDGKPLSGHNARVSQLSQGEGQSGQYKRPQLSHLLPSLELERSQHGEFSVVRNPVHPLNPLLVGPYEEEWKHQYGYGVYGGESGQHFNLPAMVPNMPPYGFLYSLGENPSTVFDFMIPTVEGEKKYRSIRDRPRDPLIEAVAAHDKSTLRKVSELDLPSARPKTVERESLLEEIRNKAFNLKPANAPKPNIKGIPQTNLKVAAILEKANAIRQAFVGSDEDDDVDGDNWSDS